MCCFSPQTKTRHNARSVCSRQGHRVRNPSFEVNLKQPLSPLLAGPHRLQPPRSSEKDVIIPEERSTSVVQIVSVNPLTTGFAQISARQRPKPRRSELYFLPAAEAALAHGSLAREVSPRPQPPRAALPAAPRPLLSAPPRPPPRSSRSFCSGGGTARAGGAAQGPRREPLPCIKEYKFNSDRRRRKEGAAPERSRLPRGPIGSLAPPPALPVRLFSKRPKFNGIIMSMGSERWGLCPGRGAVPGRPGLGERGSGPSRSPRAEGGGGAPRGGSVTPSDSGLRDRGRRGGLRNGRSRRLSFGRRGTSGERGCERGSRWGRPAEPRAGAACGPRAAAPGSAGRPRVTPPAVRRRAARCRRAGGDPARPPT